MDRNYDSGASKRKRKEEKSERQEKERAKIRSLSTYFTRDTQSQPKDKIHIDNDRTKDVRGTENLPIAPYLHCDAFKDFTVVDVPADGNCLYSCLVLGKGQKLSKKTQQETRMEIVNFLKENPQEVIDIPMILSELNDEKLDQMSKPGEWGDAVSVAAACRLYKRPINIYLMTGQKIEFVAPCLAGSLCRPTEDLPLQIGYVKYHGSSTENHYVYLQPKGSVSLSAPHVMDETSETMPSADSQCNSEPVVTSSETSSTQQPNCEPVDAQYGTNSSSVDNFPDCWNSDQYAYFKNENSWLICNMGRLGCDSCNRASKLHKSSGIFGNLSIKWSQCKVAPSGDTKTKMQTSLRKKIFEHKCSAAHKSAADMIQKHANTSFDELVSRQTANVHDTTCKVFRTAYYIALSDRPYTDHADLITLQQLNGLELGRVLQSNVICSDIIDHVSFEMRQSVVNTLVSNKSVISVLIDESTSLGKQSCLIVYVRATFDPMVGPLTLFLDLLELQVTNSDGIAAALLQCLYSCGFTEEFLKEYWLGLGTDGAAVMTGCKSGVVTQLKAQFPHIIGWHCFNHRLELAVSDAIESCTEVNHFRNLMDTLYALYSQSPKCLRELNECAITLAIQLKRIGRVLDVRWVASSFKTVSAVWQSYQALYDHFTLKASGVDLGGREKAKFSGLASKFRNPVFLKNLGLMMDALEELADLSLALQKGDINLPAATKLIKKQIEIFSARKESCSGFYQEACSAVETGNFRGILLDKTSGRLPEIPKSKFYQALADAMASRLMPASEVDLVKSIESLAVSSSSTSLDPEYGEADVRILCTKFGLSYRDIKHEYRQFRDGSDHAVGSDLRVLLNSINTIPVSTAVCERGFSKLNIICSSLRTRLSTKHISSLMFISLCGPPLEVWQPLKYVTSWLTKNRRSADCAQGPHRKTSESQGNDSIWSSMWKAM